VKPIIEGSLLTSSAIGNHPIFDAMVKNFSQMAYINTEGKGLEIFPQSESSDEEKQEGQQFR